MSSMKPKKPKLLLIGALPPPYIGTSEVTLEITRSALIRDRFELLFLDVSDTRELLSLGRFELGNVLLGLKHVVQCVLLLTTRWPDVVYFGLSQGLWGYLRDLGFFIPAAILRRSIVVHLHGSEFDRVYRELPGPLRWLSRSLFKRVRRAIVLSERLRYVFQDLVPEDRIVSVPNGIDCADFMSEDEAQAREPQKRVLWLSNLFGRKGIAEFVEAMPELRDRHPDAQITIAGEWETPELQKKVLAFVEAHRLQPYLEFVGRVGPDQRIKLLKSHDVFVLPAVRPEGMPMSILEAMSAGLAVVSTRQGAIPDLVIEGKTGSLVNPTPKEIASSLDSLLADPGRCLSMGLAGRKLVKERYSKAVQLRSLAEVLSNAASGKTPGPSARFSEPQEVNA